MSQPNLNERIQVDTSDDDSLFDIESLSGSNLSLASSVRDYSYENGRRYHAYRNGQYPFPNDEEEQDRLALTHHLFKLLTGGNLHRAPIQDSDPRRILDIGTGPGEWALEMAEDYPRADIIGTDLSPIQPNWVPPNCRFYIDDAESDWTFSPGEAFDYIHARTMAGGIEDWPRLLKQAYQHLKPGGWFEAQEFEHCVRSDDGTHERAIAINSWAELLTQASKKFGKPMDVASSISEWMTEEGFANVTDDIYKSPVGGWAKNRRYKEIGRIGKVSIMETIEPYSLALFTRVLGLSYQDAQEHMEKARAELMSGSHHLYVRFHFVYGQRPFDDEPTHPEAP
ncbi:hypothetical protein DTO013E5_231 [Penicillium roqueforti]|uniref:Methyltransferase type 11 n=1 Tax=Penicillium roqueforti (strain FM164) TaxID=1365484 RepID=W6QNB4_PENRF|nr:uncharacterized protein LCP9604111_908 [Penicillium roqueforti]CDM31137.1 hypothetical protein PROQFM164_S02g001287 [Penicillium roqueforti FM164]KAF9253382.1 hypothetical protein LCP9604111_908 [Penicillium roqueforti]KAI1838897.1 hypothetical protein CBS147337_622 [Penicillium roqueforti]KAI2681997.1 hypothetical protein CBS147355_3207 [Penicillium roqueforti]KAI2691384.1 hypothetical protein LCP963914a_1585 [Penicillium roqueforti]